MGSTNDIFLLKYTLLFFALYAIVFVVIKGIKEGKDERVKRKHTVCASVSASNSNSTLCSSTLLELAATKHKRKIARDRR